MPKPKQKCGFQTSKSNANVHSVAFNDLTSGEILALIHALQMARTISPVAQDLSDYLRNAFYKAERDGGGQRAQTFMLELAGELDVKVVSTVTDH